MKNLHVLTTDKPNFGKYLVINKEGKLCIWNTNTMGSQKTLSTQHIYITSDEEIKEGDYGLDIFHKEVRKFRNKNFQTIYDKKIILTTDQDLDGVQAIDDEFLEWFVKNPSCEQVEIQESWEFLGDDYRHGGEQTLVYKIIIPKEEPKQETLEEAARKYSENRENKLEENFSFIDFINGAKWQQEQILEFLYLEITERRPYSSSRMCEVVIEFIEQSKKKQ